MATGSSRAKSTGSRAAPVQPLHMLHSEPRLRPTSTPNGVATSHFGELRDPLLRFIADSDIIVGCVAWITDRDILAALARRPVALVVQKETWWKRRDARGAALAQRYADLRGGLCASSLPDPIGTKTFRGRPVPQVVDLAPIACVGFGQGSAFAPLMHHKFIVRCSLGADGRLVASAVWTGSFNFSSNANSSFENALEVHENTIAAAYLAEFATVASVSESMNWRFNRPSPGRLGIVFRPPPAAPKQTTRRVVKGQARKKASAKRGRPAAPRVATTTPGVRSGKASKAVKSASKKAPTAATRTASRTSKTSTPRSRGRAA